MDYAAKLQARAPRSMLQQSTGIFPHGDGDRTLMLVFFGANDAAAPEYHMHVPVDEYGDNLRSIVRRSKETMPGITVVLVSPPPIDEEKLMQCVPSPVVCLRKFQVVGCCLYVRGSCTL